ncbi:MAG: molybdopterin-dependent oxidoreductase [Alphaproteobacteria bacterium]
MAPDSQGIEIVPSTCPHDCPSTCALDVERIDAHTIGRIHGAASHDYTAGIVCVKVARYAERVHHPDRLTKPLRRKGPKGAGRDAFVEISWDEALDETALRLQQAAAKYGPETVWPYFYAGTMGLVQRDGINRLRHVMKYSREHLTICTGLSDAGWLAGMGTKQGVDSREIAHSDVVVVWGGNPVNTQVNVMTHITHARKERGTKLVVVDPYRTGTAKQADLHLMLRPGTDGALACAAMHVLFKEGFADLEYLEKYASGTEELRQHLSTRTPEWAASITGLAVEQIVEFARLIGRNKRCYFRVGYGFSRSRNGAASMFAVTCLPTVTGAWQHKGGGALYSNGGLYKLDRTLIEGMDALDKSTRLLDQSRIGPILDGDPQDIKSGPPVTALFIQNTNPLSVAPDTLRVRRGFAREDLFTCVHEQFLTETASYADIVLPATTFLEHPDMYVAGGHTYLQVVRPVIEPLAEARSNHDVICALAHRLGAKHPGFEMSAWEIMDAALKASNLPGADALADRRWIDCARDFDDMHFLNGFGHADKKFHFAPDWSKVGRDHERMPRLPDHFEIIDAPTEHRPFRLVAAPSRGFLNSSFNETPSSIKREGRPTLMIHPDDCARLGIVTGSKVKVGNNQAEITVHAKAFDGLQPGVVIVEGIWPNSAFEGGLGVNALTSAEAGPPFGGAVFHDTAVWVRAA